MRIFAQLLYLTTPKILRIIMLSVCLCLSSALNAQTHIQNAIHTLIDTISTDTPESQRSVNDRAELDHFYGFANYTPVWFEGEQPKAIVQEAITELRNAPLHGLPPPKEAINWITQAIQISQTRSLTTYDIARIDVVLTLTLFRYANHLHNGRVASPYLSHENTTASTFNCAEWLHNAILSNRLVAAINEAEPTLPLYQQLKTTLARYLKLAQTPWPPLPALPEKGKVLTGESYDGVLALYERLTTLGDITSNTPSPTDTTYNAALADGVRHFQTRHGLEPDGRLGKLTFAALNSSPEKRVQDIELSMERLRWLPQSSSHSIILVNIPSFYLYAFTDTQATQPTLSMRIIVGKAKRTPTPLFASTMEYIEFNPYWHVPQSILRKEIIHDIEENPNYLQKKNMQITGGDTSLMMDEDIIDALESGQLHIRQRPGNKNALGRIKFIVPNTMDIYLHATPTVRLFDLPRRDFSHGCIRVQHPIELAQFVLSDQPQWTKERIQAAINTKKTQRVRLKSHIPVIVFYATTVINDQGEALFFPDIYGLNKKLAATLSQSIQ